MSLSVLDFHNSMGNTISTSIILWTLSPIPGNTLRFIILGLVAASLFIYAVNPQRPLHKLQLWLYLTFDGTPQFDDAMSLSVLDFHNMGNTISTPIFLWALAPIPGNTLRFIVLGLVAASLFIYAVNRQRPLHKLGRVEDAIEVAEEILQYAKANCPRDHVQLMENEGRLLEAKLSAFKIQTRLLKTRNDTTWKKYLQNLWGILQSVNECAVKMKEIETSMLLTIQSEHERRLFADIKDSREIRESITSSTRRSHTSTRRRFGSVSSGNTVDASSIV
ncbi:hypothetical protein MVEN_00307700 [Mycena venus]|uniref:Uncharacterized protein n=1 Tax=Mycena venus TaxID=2733690 RepID=A0A8H7DBV6_9AGAR|nr:hypothetical protein MVEN_00307700 [Mycena venus]